MTTLWAKHAWLPSGWAQDVSLVVAGDGTIESIAQDSPPTGRELGILLPAPTNVHSHAFQRAIAGRTERRSERQNDSFWTWREQMYRYLERITPDQVEAIAAQVQLESLESGFAGIVEFHYLHHQPGGHPYDDIAEMSMRVAAAAQSTGIGLTLLPVMYQFGGCDGRSASGGQQRFVNDRDSFLKLCDRVRGLNDSSAPDLQTGLAPHSLRAVSREDIVFLRELAGDKPFHLHLAEQPAEVEEVLTHWGRRPVEWTLDNLRLDSNCCLIHCTQMLPHETEQLAAENVVAGLCPITEANLGDGIFDGVRWLQFGGLVAVGSDSNVQISLTGELRMLEYSQRLRDQSRSAMAIARSSTGEQLWQAACQGGALAAGRNSGAIEAGKLADLVALDLDAVCFAGHSPATFLDAHVFAGDDHTVTDVWSAGRHVVVDGRHRDRDAIVNRFCQVMRQLEADA